MSSAQPSDPPAGVVWVLGLAGSALLATAAFAMPQLVPVVATAWAAGGVVASRRGPSRTWKVLGVVGVTGGAIMIVAWVAIVVLTLFADITVVREGP